MEAVSPSDGVKPLGLEDTLTVEDDDDLDFESIYDVPFVTVNRIGDELQAEVLFSGMPDTDADRIGTALSVAGERGYRAYARVFGEYDNVTIHFSDSPDKGTVWGIFTEDLDLLDWLQ
jgi:hypothetical protein